MASGFPLIPAPGVGSALWTAVLFTHFTHVLTVPAGARPAEPHATAASAAICTVPPLYSTGTAGSSLPFLLPTPSFARPSGPYLLVLIPCQSLVKHREETHRALTLRVAHGWEHIYITSSGSRPLCWGPSASGS